MLNEKLPQNASKFAILLEYENPCSFFFQMELLRMALEIKIARDKKPPNTQRKHECHSSEIRGLCSMKSSRKMLLNLPYFWNTKTHIVFFIFHFVLLYFSPNECPGLCRHRPGHSLSINFLFLKSDWLILY